MKTLWVEESKRKVEKCQSLAERGKKAEHKAYDTAKELAPISSQITELYLFCSSGDTLTRVLREKLMKLPEHWQLFLKSSGIGEVIC